MAQNSVEFGSAETSRESAVSFRLSMGSMPVSSGRLSPITLAFGGGFAARPPPELSADARKGSARGPADFDSVEEVDTSTPAPASVFLAWASRAIDARNLSSIDLRLRVRAPGEGPKSAKLSTVGAAPMSQMVPKKKSQNSVR